MDFAKGKQSNLQLKDVSISDLFKEIYEDLSMIAEQKNINLVIENSVKEKVKLDYTKIKRTIINITKNAIEAIVSKGEITISAVPLNNKQIQISISDNGPGIPEEIINNIFDPFVTSGKESGTGLGLAICSKVVRDHNGEISVRNKKIGAEFVISLPCNPY